MGGPEIKHSRGRVKCRGQRSQLARGGVGGGVIRAEGLTIQEDIYQKIFNIKSRRTSENYGGGCF